MSTVSGTSSGLVYSMTQSTSSATATDAATATTKKDDPSERFLKLLVAQMQNQDPMNPMDNAQVTSQMAQISTVQGIEKLNDSMKAMLERSSLASQIESASLIGRDVLVSGNGFALAGGTARTDSVRLGAELAADAASAKAEILDATGAVVRTLDLGRRAAGVHGIEWDGRDDTGRALADGGYTLRVTAADAIGNAVGVTTLAPATVASVSAGTDGARIELRGDGSRAASDIKGIL